jgi:hypothetical protein
MPRLIAHRSETTVNLWGEFTWPEPDFPAFSPCSLKGKPFERAGRKATDLPEFLQ